MDVVWDMETEDPDDFLTLLLLCGHPGVRLKAVTIYPGTPEQVGLVRHALDWFESEIPVGAFDPGCSQQAVSPWHYRAYGKIGPSFDVAPAEEVLLNHCDAQTTLITGAPLHNLIAALKIPAFHIGRWVCQGGFAGEGVVPSRDQLAQFAGYSTCPTYNLSASPPAVVSALNDERIGTRRFVGKNVCHGVVYDPAHSRRTRPRLLRSGASSSPGSDWGERRIARPAQPGCARPSAPPVLPSP